MRIFNRPHIPWLFFVVLATALSGWIYLGNFHPAGLPASLALPPTLVQKVSGHRSVGGTPVGLIFGTVSLAIFIFGALLSLRKKIPLWPIGSVQRWLRAHIWLTLLTIPLVLLHSGFRLGGPMTILLLVFYAAVMLSGIYGLYLQHRMPRLMKEQLPIETVYQQIPYVRSQLLQAAERMRNSLRRSAIASLSQPDHLTAQPVALVAADPPSEAALVTFLEEQVLPYLKARRGRRFRLADRRYSDDAFRFVNLSVAETYRDRVGEMQGWCDERRMLDLQVHLHHWLHGWLFVHVPFSFLLILLTAWHAVVTLFYY